MFTKERACTLYPLWGKHWHLVNITSPLPLPLPLSPQMKVTGKNLLNVCKLLFAVARSETNDKLFLEEELSG